MQQGNWKDDKIEPINLLTVDRYCLCNKCGFILYHAENSSNNPTQNFEYVYFISNKF